MNSDLRIGGIELERRWSRSVYATMPRSVESLRARILIPQERGHGKRTADPSSADRDARRARVHLPGVGLLKGRLNGLEQRAQAGGHRGLLLARPAAHVGNLARAARYPAPGPSAVGRLEHDPDGHALRASRSGSPCSLRRDAGRTPHNSRHSRFDGERIVIGAFSNSLFAKLFLVGRAHTRDLRLYLYCTSRDGASGRESRLVRVATSELTH